MDVATMLTSGVCSQCGSAFQSTRPDVTLCMLCAYSEDHDSDHDTDDEIYCVCCERVIVECDEFGYCCECVAREAAASAHQDAIDEAEGERDEASDDVERLEAEIAELRAELAEAKRRLKSANGKLAKLGAE